MKPYFVLLLAAVFGLAGCSKKEKVPQAKAATESNATGNPITAPVDYLGAVAKAKRFAGTTLDLASLKQSIQMFHAQEDRYPKNLNELVATHYLQGLPSPPPGRKLAYNPNTGDVRMVVAQ